MNQQKTTFDRVGTPQKTDAGNGLLSPGSQNPDRTTPEASDGAPAAPQAGPKEEFDDVFKQHAVQQSDLMHRAGTAASKRAAGMEDAVAKANEALGGSGGAKNDQADLDELSKITEEDLKLAEELIFRGHADFSTVVPNFPSHQFTLCSTTAEEVALVEEIIYDRMKQNEDAKTGDVNLPRANIDAFRSALLISLAYRGMDGKDMCDQAIHQLNLIKKAIGKVKEYEISGEMDKMRDLRLQLKSSVIARAARIMSMPTPMIDFLTRRKFDFDSKMFTIMTTKNLIPKS